MTPNAPFSTCVALAPPAEVRRALAGIFGAWESDHRNAEPIRSRIVRRIRLTSGDTSDPLKAPGLVTDLLCGWFAPLRFGSPDGDEMLTLIEGPYAWSVRAPEGGLMPVTALARRLAAPVIRFGHDSESPHQPAYLYGTHASGSARRISLLREAGRWQYRATGRPFGWEDDLAAAPLQKRLTVDLLRRYMKRLSPALEPGQRIPPGRGERLSLGLRGPTMEQVLQRA